MRQRLQMLDRRLGRIWSRICGAIFLLIALCATITLVDSKSLALHRDWPGIVIAALFWAAGYACFRSRQSLSDGLSDGPQGRKRNRDAR